MFRACTAISDLLVREPIPDGQKFEYVQKMNASKHDSHFHNLFLIYP